MMIFLIWLNLCWSLFLFGAFLAYVAMHGSTLRPDKDHGATREKVSKWCQ